MKFRYAKEEDIYFLIEGLEKNRVLENRPKKDAKAKPADIKEFKTAIRNKNIRIIEDKGEPVAFLYFRTGFKVMYIHEKFFWVDLIYVKEGYRGRGLGKRLYNDAIRIAKKKGFSKVVIDVFEANANSVGFHKKLGFKPIYAIYQKRI